MDDGSRFTPQMQRRSVRWKLHVRPSNRQRTTLRQVGAGEASADNHLVDERRRCCARFECKRNDSCTIFFILKYNILINKSTFLQNVPVIHPHTSHLVQASNDDDHLRLE